MVARPDKSRRAAPVETVGVIFQLEFSRTQV
jgi:hypothetical protein